MKTLWTLGLILLTAAPAFAAEGLVRDYRGTSPKFYSGAVHGTTRGLLYTRLVDCKDGGVSSNIVQSFLDGEPHRYDGDREPQVGRGAGDQAPRSSAQAKVVPDRGSPRAVQHEQKLPANKLLLVHGGARGLDRMAGVVAQRMEWNVLDLPAPWAQHRQAAGPIRNQALIDLKPDLATTREEAERQKQAFQAWCTKRPWRSDRPSPRTQQGSRVGRPARHDGPQRLGYVLW